MKKTVWALLMLLATAPLWAGSGASRDDAKEFDWTNGMLQTTLGTTWYHISTDPITRLEDPQMIIRLLNKGGDSLHVTLTLEVEKISRVETRSYVIAPYGEKTWSEGVAMMKPMDIQEILLAVDGDQPLQIIALASEAEDIDEACLNAAALVGTKTVNKGAETWHRLELGTPGDSVYVLHYTNTGTAKASVTRNLSPTCPVGNPASKRLSIAKGQTYHDTISNAMLTLLGETAYLQVIGTQKLTVSGEKIKMPGGAPAPITGCAATDLEPEIWQELVGNTSAYFRVPLSLLHAARRQPQICLDNTMNSEEAHATIDIVIDGRCPSNVYIAHDLTVAAGEQNTLDLSRDMVMAIDSNTVTYIYVRVTTDQDMAGMWRMKHLHEGNACKSASVFNWVDGHYIDADANVWFALPIREAKQTKHDIVATIRNRGEETASVTGIVVFECPNYTDGQEGTRSLASGAQSTKTIEYSTFSSLNTDTLWLCIITDQPLFISAHMEPTEEIIDEGCRTATAFDWDNGHVQDADTIIWYKIPLDSIRNAVKEGQLPYLTIYNRGAVAGSFTSAYSYECPSTTKLSETARNINGLGSYEKLISTDMINQLNQDIDTAYLRIQGTQPFSFQVKMVMPDEGSNCAHAIPFNWVTGNDYTKDEPAWYRLDLREAKASKKDLVISLTNKEQTAGTIHAEMATSCPCKTNEKKNYTLAAGAVRTDTIPNASIQSFGDSLWFRLTAPIDLHFEARLVDPAPFDTIYVTDTIRLEYNHLYTIEDTTWFYILTDIVGETELAPKVTLHNGTTPQTISADIAYECPITVRMMENTSKFNAGQSKVKMLERSTAESMAAQHDTIWVRLTGSVPGAQFTFRVDLVDPNDGKDCAHARFLQPDTAIIVKKNGTIWYYLNREQLAQNHSSLQLIYHNLGSANGTTDITIQANCESDPIVLHSNTITPGSPLTDEIPAVLLEGIDSKYVYLQFYCEQKDSIEVKAVPSPEIDSLFVCDQATAVLPNTVYSIAAGQTVWYNINLNDLRENYVGDGTVIMTNSGSETLHVTGSMSWTCRIGRELNQQQYTLAAGEDYVEILTRDALDHLNEDMVWFCLTADQDMTWTLEMLLDRGETCSHGVIFDWDNGNVHPADTYLWYTVFIDSARVDGHDLLLHIDNISDQTVNVTCVIKTDCRAKNPLQTLGYTFEPGTGKQKSIDLDLIKSSGQWPSASWSLNYYSSDVTRIWVELIDEEPDRQYYDTLRYTLCDETEFEYQLGEKTYTHIIDSKDRASLTWNDTTQVREGTYLVDSIHTFIIRPIVAPDTALFMPQAQPIFRQGMPIFTDSATAQILRYYAEYPYAYPEDSILPITSIEWEIATSGTHGTPLEEAYPGALTKDDQMIENIRCVLNLGEGCEDMTGVLSQTFSVAPQGWRTDSIHALDTLVCVGSLFTAIDGETYTIGRDTTLRIRRADIIVPDTLGLDRTIDSLYVYDFRTYRMPKPTLLSSLKAQTQPKAAIGQSIDYEQANLILTTTYGKAQPEGVAAIDTMLWQVSLNEEEAFRPLDPSYVLTCEDLSLRIRHAIVTAPCGDTLYSDTLTIEPTPLPIFVPSFEQDSALVICGEPINIAQPDEAIRAAIAEDETFSHTTLEGIDWDFRLTDADEWKPITDQDTMDSRIDEVNLRVTIHTTCGDVDESFTRSVAPASAENVAAYNNLQASQKYGNRLLMINLNAIMEKIGDSIPAEEVEWYERIGEVDRIEVDEEGMPYLVPDAPDKADVLRLTGSYYYTLHGQQLPGDYYALIRHQGIVEEGKCGVTMRTEVLTFKGEPAAAATRKQLEQGTVVIISDDDNRYDTNGRKL